MDPSGALYGAHDAIVPLRPDSQPRKSSITSFSDSAACSIRHSLPLPMNTTRKRHRLPEGQLVLPHSESLENIHINYPDSRDIKHHKNVVKPTPKRMHSGSQVPIITNKSIHEQLVLLSTPTMESESLFLKTNTFSGKRQTDLVCPSIRQYPFEDSGNGRMSAGSCSSSSNVNDLEEMSNSLEKIEVTNEGSQARMEMLAVAEANTQECSQLWTDKSNTCSLRLRLHPDMQSSITSKERALLEKKGLVQIEIHRLNSRKSLGRDDFLDIFGTSHSKIQPIKLSRTHCVIEGYTQRDHDDLGVYVTDKSTNGVRIDGVLIRM